MSEPESKRKKQSNYTKDELLQLEKKELIERLLRYQSHNEQLKNIIKKQRVQESTTELKHKRKLDFTKYHYRKILLHIFYFGWDYQGFVVQEDTANTIEHHLMHALFKSCLIECRENADYHRCGRTDKGVSAFGQVISLRIRSKHPAEDQYKPEAISSEMPYCYILNNLLPRDIRAVAWMPIPADKPEYSARFDCTKRQYKYYFPRAALNIAAMRDACARLIGSHDFRNLCKMDVGNGVIEFTREILSAAILPVGGKESEECTAMYYLKIEGNAFLWHQIRCIMGILLLVGEGKEPSSIITELLDVKKNPRKPQYSMASDLPLNLFHCSYNNEGNNWVYQRKVLRLVIEELQKTWTSYNIKTTMIKDSLNELESVYSTLKEEKDAKDNGSDGDTIIEYGKGLLLGITPKVYRPLLKRKTCATLEEKIEYYNRRKGTNFKIKTAQEASQPDQNVDQQCSKT